MNFKRYVDWACAIVIGLALGAVLAGPAHAYEQPVVQPATPAYSIEMHGRDSYGVQGVIDVVDDPKHGVVCYVAKSYEKVGISCVARKSL